MQGGDRCGQSCDFWNNYEADIARAASLNSNCFRLSLEWSRIEPSRGQFDRQAIARYHAIFDCLEKCAPFHLPCKNPLKTDQCISYTDSVHLIGSGDLGRNRIAFNGLRIVGLFDRHGLKPCVTLHHFVHPLWFDGLGAFEKEENIPYFADFAAAAFRCHFLHSIAKTCSTICSLNNTSGSHILAFVRAELLLEPTGFEP